MESCAKSACNPMHVQCKNPATVRYTNQVTKVGCGFQAAKKLCIVKAATQACTDDPLH